MRSVSSKQNATKFTRMNRAMSVLKHGLPFLIGLVVGVGYAPVFWVAKNRDLNSAPASPVSTASNFRSIDGPTGISSETKNGYDNGWHSIHVYYGKRDRIPTKTSQFHQNYEAGSQVDQDKIILALTRSYQQVTGATTITTPGYFIDLAANDAVQLSNTYHLEQNGWDGLCIEPNPAYWYRLAHRTCTVAAAFVGGKEDLLQVDVSLGNEEYGGIVGEGMDNTVQGTNAHDETKKLVFEKRYTVSLRTLFRLFRVPATIDYLSLDVEGAEELIMQDFPLEEYVIRFMTVERPKPSLQTLLLSKGFVFAMQLIFWGETLWVHKSVIADGLSLDQIRNIVNGVSKYPKQRAPRGRLVWDRTTGAYTSQ